MRGVIELPLESGLQLLCWNIGSAIVNGTNQVNATVALQNERDADFIMKRAWLLQYPLFTGAAADLNLALPPQTSVRFTDGGTKRSLSLLAGFAQAMIPDTNPNKAARAWLGLPCPFLMRANSTLYAEITNPGAAAVAWVGDILLVAEGYKLFPGREEVIPRSIKQYAIPYGLNTNAIVANPAAAAGNISGQTVIITNNGEGRFIAKGFQVQMIDAAGVDRTNALLACVGFNIKDSTTGYQTWVRNPNQGAGVVACPASVLNLHQSMLPFNTPRFIDPNGSLEIQVVFPNIAAALAYLNAAATWPVTFTININGALLPL